MRPRMDGPPADATATTRVLGRRDGCLPGGRVRRGSAPQIARYTRISATTTAISGAGARAPSTARHNTRIQATTPQVTTPSGARGATRPLERAGVAATRIPEGALRALGACGLVGVLASAFLLAAGAASAPTQYVPARSGGWSDWLAGPLQGLGIGLDGASFQALTLIMCAGYAAALLGARALSVRALWGAILAAHLCLLLGPPLLSQDVFGYLSFARMGVLHGLDPYTHVAFQAPTDAVFPFVGWPFQHSPYGPLFTLASYALAPLGLAGGLWTLKALAVGASLGGVALVARAARRERRRRLWA
jgi:hypothetical protein